MANAEQEGSQVDGLIPPNPQLTEEIVGQSDIERIPDLSFRELVKKVSERLTPLKGDFFDVNESLKAMVDAHPIPDVIPGSRLASFSKQLLALPKGVFQSVEQEPAGDKSDTPNAGKNLDGPKVADRFNMWLALSILYVPSESVGREHTKTGKSVTLLRITKAAELWGKTQMGQELRTLAADIEQNGFRYLKERVFIDNSTDTTFFREMTSEESSELLKYKQITSDVLKEIYEEIEKNRHTWVRLERVRADELGLAREAMEWIEFVYWVARSGPREADEGLFVVGESKEQIKYCIEQMERAESNARAEYPNRNIRKANLYDLIVAKKSQLKKQKEEKKGKW